MKTILETYLGAFFLFLLIACSFSCVSAALSARSADISKTQYVQELEDSDFADWTIRKVFDDAEDKGYDIGLWLYQEGDGETFVSGKITNASEIPAAQGKTYMARIELTFDYAFPLFNAITEHTLLGYAK